MKKLILASNSPRRKELLSMAGYAFQIRSPKTDEVFEPELSIGENLENIAFLKALSVFKTNKDFVVLGVDTLVSLEERVLGKPKDKDDARNMLNVLSGKTHMVTSAFSVISTEKSISTHVNSFVTFKKLEDDEIEEYLSTDEPWDKAGAYAIQGKASVFIKEIKGCYYNIMGLPLSTLYDTLRKEFGIVPDMKNNG